MKFLLRKMVADNSANLREREREEREREEREREKREGEERDIGNYQFSVVVAQTNLRLLCRAS